LEFERITENSLDGVSDRDFAIELASCLSIIMVHLSRFSEEIILWSSLEFGFIELDDAYSTGSSIMPQKRTPMLQNWCVERAGRVLRKPHVPPHRYEGSSPGLQQGAMQEDKEARMFDAVDTVKGCHSWNF
jgi:argininosuccinate lyase